MLARAERLGVLVAPGRRPLTRRPSPSLLALAERGGRAAASRSTGALDVFEQIAQARATRCRRRSCGCSSPRSGSDVRAGRDAGRALAARSTSRSSALRPLAPGRCCRRSSRKRLSARIDAAFRRANGPKGPAVRVAAQSRAAIDPDEQRVRQPRDLGAGGARVGAGRADQVRDWGSGSVGEDGRRARAAARPAGARAGGRAGGHRVHGRRAGRPRRHADLL